MVASRKVKATIVSISAVDVEGQIVTLSGYDLHSVLDSGANGAVIEATDRALGRRVAIKIWPLQRRDGDRRDKRKQALAESKKLAALKHEGIVTVHRFIPGDTFVALDMEFLDGQTLKEWLKTYKRNLWSDEQDIDLRHRSALLERVLDALEYAHTQGVLHGDIHDRNVMIMDPVSPNPILLDFGTSVFAGRNRLLRSNEREVKGIMELTSKVLPELEHIQIMPAPEGLTPGEAVSHSRAAASILVELEAWRSAFRRNDEYHVRWKPVAIAHRVVEAPALRLDNVIAAVRRVSDADVHLAWMLAMIESLATEEINASSSGTAFDTSRPLAELDVAARRGLLALRNRSALTGRPEH